MMKLWVSVRWAVALSVAGGGISIGTLPVAAQASWEVEAQEIGHVSAQPLDSITHLPIHPSTHLPTHMSTPQPATTVEEWLAQIEASLVQITGVQIEETATGLQIVLETAEGELATPTTQTVGNALVADIPNAVLALPEGDSFEQFEPAAGIALVQVTNEPGDQVRVAITGTDAPPVGEVTATGLAVTLGEAVADAEEDAIQVVVTGEEDEGYNPRSTSVGTRTDTPLRDIPQSIQIVPRAVIRDTGSRNITQALENVPGLVAQGLGAANTRDYFTARGFEQYDALVNGLPDRQITSDGNFFNVERVEVIRGPASALYGDGGNGSVGALINYVTRRPLSDPFYEVEASVGNDGFYQGTIDVSGPLNPSESALGRLIVGYRNYDSPVDFASAENIGIAPSLSFQIGDRASLIVEGDVHIVERNNASPVPVVGTLLPNPNGEIPFGFNPAGPFDDPSNIINGRVGYQFEYQFNDDWELRNAFRYNFAFDELKVIFATTLDADNRTLNREGFFTDRSFNYYLVDTNLLGRFTTGTIEHEVVFGFSLSRFDIDSVSGFGLPVASVDIFDPVFDQNFNTEDVNDDSLNTTDVAGFYMQDQITLLPNLRLLLGGRLDFSENRNIDRLADTESSQSDTAFSPRVGIVYQPIEPISLYASYGRSFNPLIGRSFSGEALEPERGTQYEIGIKADVTDQLSANLALYDLTRTNVTTSDPVNPGFSVQSGEQRSRGVELDISGEILPGWNIIAGYAYTDARIVEDNDIPEGNRLFNAPEHAFNLWTTYRIQEGAAQGLGFGLGLYYIGERPIDNANTVDLPSFFRTDAAIFYEREQFQAALNVRNLFDVENYVSNFGSSDFVHIGTPFTIQGSLSWQF
ncbi:MAG: TonB-dependent siderophore receptor [Leptolyngbya sp. SIO1E4]|nr:TonB-dependent siderophore receptor [Leptolyngbya sp. SIO1E4]